MKLKTLKDTRYNRLRLEQSFASLEEKCTHGVLVD